MRKFIGFVFLAGLIFGCIEAWDWLRYRTPVEASFDSNDLAVLPRHVTLKNIFLSPGDAVSPENGRHLFIPIRSMTGSERSSSPVKNLRFLLKTRDPELLAAYAKLDEQKSFPDGLVAMKPMLGKREVSGMLQDHGLTTKERAKMLELLPVLAADFTVLEEGRHPSLFTMVFLFGVSALALFIYGKLDRTPAVAPPVQAGPPPPSSAEPPPLPDNRK